MNCSACGAPLPQGANVCPNCGTATASYVASIGANEPTVASHYNYPQPSTNYGTDPYSAPPSPYNSGPYHSLPSQPPYIPPPQKRRSPLLAIILVIIAVLVVGSGGFALYTQNQNNNTLHAQQTATATSKTATTVAINNMNATATAIQQNSKIDPYLSGEGTLIVNDPMHDNSQGNEWDESTSPAKGGGTATCGFKGNTYHLSRTQGGSLVCPTKAANLSLSNLVLEAKLTLNKGDYSGLAFRVNRQKWTGYVCVIGVSGDYAIDTFDFGASSDKEYKVLSKGDSVAIKRGWNQANVVAIAASNNAISLYVNGQLVTSIQDNTYTQGSFGLYGYGQSSFDVASNGVRVWQL